MTEKASDRITPMDKHIAARIRKRRVELGFTQQRLAEHIDITYQQVHKIERGINRVSAGRLHVIASILQVPLTYFSDDFDAPGPAIPHQIRVVEFVRNLQSIDEARLQKIGLLVQELAKPKRRP